jgi:hypothetical protein
MREPVLNKLEQIRRISPHQLLDLGVNDVAYLRDVEVDGGTAVAIFAANGKRIGVFADRQQAVAALFQNGITPITVQ